MRSFRLTLFAPLLTFNFSPSVADKCAAPPLNLPYRNVSIAPGVLYHGIPIQIGSPWQTIALTPALQLDNTFLPRFTNTCILNDATPMSNLTARSLHLFERDGHPGAYDDNRGLPGASNASSSSAAWEGDNWWVKCGELYGGAYQPSLSDSSHDTGTNNADEEWWFKRQNYSDWKLVTEMWSLGDYLDFYTKTFEALPASRNITSTFLLSDKGKSFGGIGTSQLGLTPNSTVLKALVDKKMIPSTSWTLTNENLCLGCEDASAHVGDFNIIKPTDREKDPKLPCLLQTKVEALNWHPKRDAEGASLIQSSFTACIEPGVQFLVLPNDARGSFKKILDRQVKGEYEDYIAFKGPPKEDAGHLTFRLGGGLEVNVTVPGSGNVSAIEEKSGEWKVPIGKGGWGAYGNETWVLGQPFTSAIILRWDSLTSSYGLANPNTDSARKPDIKHLGCGGFPSVEKIITSTPGTGIVVGSVIGGFVAGIVLAMAGVAFYSRGKKGVKSNYEVLGDTVPMRTMGSQESKAVDGWRSGVVSPPSRSIHSVSSYERGGSMGLTFTDGRGGHGRGLSEAGGRALHEAPAEGTAYPTKREGVQI